MTFPYIPNYVIISGEKNSGEIIATASAILSCPNHIPVSTDNYIRKEFLQAFKTFNWREVVFEFSRREAIENRLPTIHSVSSYSSSYNTARQIIPTLTKELTFDALQWSGGKSLPSQYSINYENMKQVAETIIVSNSAEFIKFKKFTFWIALDKQGYSLAQDIYYKFSGEDPDELPIAYKIYGFHKLNLIEQEILPPMQTHPLASEYYAWFKSIYKSLAPWNNLIEKAMSHFS
jgi:hypothetical protein